MQKLMQEVKKFIADENGLTTAEWVLLASAVVVAAMGVVGVIMPKIHDMAAGVESNLSTQPYNYSTNQR